jgi:hypothetical protein
VLTFVALQTSNIILDSMVATFCRVISFVNESERFISRSVHAVASTSPIEDICPSPSPEKASCDKVKHAKGTEQGISEGAEETKTEFAEDAALDPPLPLNWSGPKKCSNMAIPSVLCFVV